MPVGWHIFYLGGSHGERPEFFNHLFERQLGTWGAFAYIVHKRAYKDLIAMLNEAHKIVDGHYIDYQKNYLCLKPKKKLVTHPPGFSTIKERHVQYNGIK